MTEMEKAIQTMKNQKTVKLKGDNRNWKITKAAYSCCICITIDGEKESRECFFKEVMFQ